MEKARTRRREGARDVVEDAIDADANVSTVDRSLRGKGEPTLMLATCERAGRIVSGARRAEGEMEARIFRAVDEVERRKNVASFFCEFLLLKKMGNLLQLTLVRRQRERRHRLSPSFSLSHTQLRSRQQPALALPRSLMRASPTRRMGSYERFQDSVRLAFFKRERLEMVFGSIGENRCSTDAFSLFLFFPLSLSLSFV